MYILIIHGIGGHAGIHWQQWLHNELVSDGHTVIMPSLPQSDHPDRKTWFTLIQETLHTIDTSQLVIVGHSLGVAAALDVLEVIKQPIVGLVSVSGFAAPYGAELNEYFMKEKVIDFSKVVKNINHAAVLYGDNDPYVTQDALDQVAKGLKVKPHIISGGGHINSETGYTEFPLLLEIIKSWSN